MHDIIVRFPSKEMADYFCGQMSDGFGEGFCDFTKCTFEDEKQVYSVEWIEDFDDGKDPPGEEDE